MNFINKLAIVAAILFLSLNLFAQNFDGTYKGSFRGDRNGVFEFTVTNNYNISGKLNFEIAIEREINGYIERDGKIHGALLDKSIGKDYKNFLRGTFEGQIREKEALGVWNTLDIFKPGGESAKGEWKTGTFKVLPFSVTLLRGIGFVRDFAPDEIVPSIQNEADSIDWQPLIVNQKRDLKNGIVFAVKTLPDTRVQVTYPDEATFMVKSDTRAKFIPNAVQIVSGEVFFVIEKINRSFVTNTPSAWGVVRGTEYLVSVLPNGTTRYFVFRGAVEISDKKNTRTILVRENESTIIKLNGEPSMPTKFNPADIDHWWKDKEQKVVMGSRQWNGEWQSKWGKMVIVQNGNEVTGTYEHDNGKIKGTIIGNKLIGTWSEAPTYLPPNDAGEFEMIIAPDGKSFTGKWRYGTTGKWESGWNGSRF